MLYRAIVQRGVDILQTVSHNPKLWTFHEGSAGEMRALRIKRKNLRGLMLHSAMAGFKNLCFHVFYNSETKKDVLRERIALAWSIARASLLWSTGSQIDELQLSIYL